MASVGALLASAEGGIPPYASVLPFVLTLLGIAILPLFAGHWWEKNRNKAIFSWGIAIPTAIWWVAAQDPHRLVHVGVEYTEFIALLGALYVASGGIYVRGTLRGRPGTNVSMLAIGAVIANLVGTTGASMLLIRPFLRANAHRSMRARCLGVIFFIFAVSNVGGCLTPLGDPPLFLGFLRGVSFTWTLALVKEWVFCLALILAVYFLWDRKVHAGEPPAPPHEGALEPLGLSGARNLFLLLGVVGVVLGQGIYDWPYGIQVGAMIAIAALSMYITPIEVRRSNRFTFGPILEVAILFSGIFVTMLPALVLLAAKGKEMGLTEPWHFFWATGSLSSFLDNAPTYLTFGTVATSQANGKEIGDLMTLAPDMLAAVSLGSVFMGANTYIGNGPNFMVKAIAEENGVAMPSFFGYMRYSVGILVPLFILVTFVFLL